MPACTAMLVAALVGAWGVYLTLVLPHYLEVFAEFGVELPHLTLGLSHASGAMVGQGLAVTALWSVGFLLAGGLLAVGMVAFSRRVPMAGRITTLCLLLLAWAISLGAMVMAILGPHMAMMNSLRS